ncbi:hypothetical protein ACFSB1_00890 [Halopseudomonas phragmitis]|uniref:Uncharacterized protein n=1 Tax=Halopseudomonas phragmitis TaxID=1931241 RepID=A0A1V0B6X0_9GAMM|nr:hypothetical protein [Halopseudomonas phragmitis]AQZ95534.1 hypothetical protein BVH74_12585 [Halopseudomonas phragmitis]
MGELIEFQAPQRESKVFTRRVKASLALANAVTRELRKHGCTVLLAAVDGERPFLVVEADAPLHVVPWGRFGLFLQQTPGNFVACQSYLLGCQIHWKIRPVPVGRVG